MSSCARRRSCITSESFCIACLRTRAMSEKCGFAVVFGFGALLALFVTAALTRYACWGFSMLLDLLPSIVCAAGPSLIRCTDWSTSLRKTTPLKTQYIIFTAR